MRRRGRYCPVAPPTRQIRKLLEAGLSTDEIGYLQPCVTGPGADLESCPETLDTLRGRLHRLDEQIDTLARTRQALREHIDDTERRVSGQYQPCDSATPEPTPK